MMKIRELILNTAILAASFSFLFFILLIDTGNNSQSYVMDEILNLCHLPLFGVLAIILIYVMNNRSWPVRDFRKYILSIMIASILGILTEILQTMTSSRHFEIMDILRDSVGALTFLVIAHPSDESSAHKLSPNRIISLTLILIFTFPVLTACIDSWRMNRDFPLIDSFETFLETGRVTGNESTYQRSTMHATHGEYSLQIFLHPGDYTGVAIRRLKQDWRGYDAFSFDAYLEESEGLSLTVKIFDRPHNFTYGDRFNKVILLNPGNNHINISIKDVRRSPRERTLHMDEIVHVSFFSCGLKNPHTVYLDNIRLER